MRNTIAKIIIKKGIYISIITTNRSDQLSDTKDSVAEIEKCVESDHCCSGNDHDTVDDDNQLSDSIPTRVY